MSSAKPMTSPMATGLKLTVDAGDPFDDPTLYRYIVGGLQYATITKPEITFVVNKVCQYMHAPKQQHWQAAKRILGYLAGTTTMVCP